MIVKHLRHTAFNGLIEHSSCRWWSAILFFFVHNMSTLDKMWKWHKVSTTKLKIILMQKLRIRYARICMGKIRYKKSFFYSQILDLFDKFVLAKYEHNFQKTSTSMLILCIFGSIFLPTTHFTYTIFIISFYSILWSYQIL